ncbi:hypothetical protein PHJA_001996500 [Phtheirospermum japonicum]|uniref:DUF4378 domain-containing protein n=1 Tax=Phtheirospermum japonicum TaxID=374723 RepID=A0A830CH00_9LAMI|nr:hypothetical protein PHJA_001996500 [Phtheirospermum japonicum]
MMLKDFLRDDYYQHSCTSCKSTAFSKSNKPPPAVVLLRSWSKKAAATKVSAVQKLINAVRFLQFVKSPLTVLPRSNSRKLGKGKKDILADHVMPEEGKVKVKVKVKDILRWRSFRDTVEDESTPLDYPTSPNRTTTTTTSSCSKRSSWCDSDFTAEEELPFWGGENEDGLLGKKCFHGTNAALLRNTKGDWSIEECEQQSPVSVFDSPFQEVRESISPYHPIVANFERARCILTRRIEELDCATKSKHTRKHSFRGEIAICEGVNEAEDKAKQLLSHVKGDSQTQQVNNDHMIYDFFMHELSINGKLPDIEFDNEILRMAKSWINGEYAESYEWEVENTREAYVKDMEKGVFWNKFKQEQEEMSIELEVMVLNELIDEALVEFFTE